MIANHGLAHVKGSILDYEGPVALENIATRGDVDMPDKASRNVENFILAKKINWNGGITNLRN